MSLVEARTGAAARSVGGDELVVDGRIAGCDVESLAAEFGTPLYLYDLGVVSRQVAALRRVLPSRVDVAYAVKANPALGVVSHLAGLGVGADVASAGELATALRAGVARDSIVMTGPGKRDDELRAAVGARIRAITVESLGELERLDAIAADADVRVPVLLRAAFAAGPALERVRLVGDSGAGKFGMAHDDLATAARRASRSVNVRLLGVHAFGASNVVGDAALAAHVASVVELGRELSLTAGFPLAIVDAGGGLGIPYAAGDQALDLSSLGDRLAALDVRMAADPVTRGTRILLEPGRFLVGPAGAYVTRVVDRKRGAEGEVVIVDGGIHHVLRPALTGQQHRIRAISASRRAAQPSRRVTIAGPLCSGLDILARDLSMAPPDVGDLVAVLDVGAYGFTESMPLFLSHPISAEVAVRDGRSRLLRPRVEPEAWLATQSDPTW